MTPGFAEPRVAYTPSSRSARNPPRPHHADFAPEKNFSSEETSAKPIPEPLARINEKKESFLSRVLDAVLHAPPKPKPLFSFA